MQVRTIYELVADGKLAQCNRGCEIYDVHRTPVTVGHIGLFSNWVGDDILAMARPSNRLLKEFSIVEQFRRYVICELFILV